MEVPKSMPIREGITSSVVVKFFIDVFDSVKGKENQPRNEINDLRKEVSDRNFHSLFWKVSCDLHGEKFEAYKFSDEKTEIYTIISKLGVNIKRFLTVMENFEENWI